MTRAALNQIRRYEALVGVPANFASPYLNPGRVVDWVQTVNHTRLSNTRPIELDDDPWGLAADNRRAAILTSLAAAQDAIDEAVA